MAREAVMSASINRAIIRGCFILFVQSLWGSEPLCSVETPQGFAALCISTVDHVLSAAWQMFSNGHSAHFGRRAMHSARP